jgi:hypothetical protein
MMKTYSFKFLTALILSLGMVVSCSKDKGNYDYKILDPVAVNVTGIAPAYSMLRFEYLDIKPVVTYKGEVVNPDKPQFPELNFTWEMYPAQVNKDVIDRHEIGKTLQLHHQMTEQELSWEVLFTVTNTNTGVKTFTKFNAVITPALAEGWMVLYEKNGNTDIGLITNNEISKAATTEKLFLDIYSASNGKAIEGTPGSLIFSVANLGTLMRLYIQTSKDAVSVVPTTFQKIVSFDNDLFWTTPAVKAPTLVKATESRKEFMINNNKLHVINYVIIAPGSRAFGDALGGTYGTLAPWLATSTSPVFDAILYDQTNKKFMKVISNGSEVIPLATAQSAMAPFDVNNVGLEFLMADNGWNNWEYFVMKDAANKYYMLSANFKEGETALIGKGKYDMSNCPEIASINSITAGFYGEIFYYSAKNHLYQFKYTPGVTDLLWTAPEDEVITNIALQKHYNTNRAAGVLLDPKNLCKILYVATYNNTTKIGTVYQMEVNVSSGAIIPGTEKKYTGFGKIKAMAWKALI